MKKILDSSKTAIINAWPDNKGGKLYKGDLYGLLLLMVVLWGAAAVLLMTASFFKAPAVAANRFLARMNAPLVGTLYAKADRDQIQILLYDDAFINREGLSWPLKYAEQADYLLAAAGNGDQDLRPKALFLDITFSQERPEDKTISILRNAICTIQNDWGIPVFLAALPKIHGGPLRVRDGLQGAQKNGKSCFSLVDVTATQDALDGYAWSYQLTNANGEASAALAMYKTVSGRPIDVPANEKMALDWGVISAPDPILGGWTNCQLGTGDWWPKMPPYLYVPGWFGTKDVRPICPYHAAVTMRWMIQGTRDEMAQLLAKKYVFIGAQITGLNDTVNSPVHGILAGVHAHAMAVDNLLQLNGNYRLSSNWSDIFSSKAAFFNLSLVLTLAGLAVFLLKYLNKYLYAWSASTGFTAFDNAAAALKLRYSRASILERKIVGLLRFLFNVAVGIALATLIVYGFQFIGLRVGYLASMELAFWIVALEAFDILDDFVNSVKEVSGE